MIFIYTFTFHGFKKNRPNDQFPDGLLAQLVMTSAIPVQRSRVRIPYKPDLFLILFLFFFFSGFVFTTAKVVSITAMIFFLSNSYFRSSNI